MRIAPLLCLLACWTTLASGQELLVPQGAAEMLLLHREPVELPPEAAESGIRGRVRFLIHVGPDGRVKAAHLLDGHPLLADAARKAVLRYRFRPLAPKGRPAGWKSIISVPVPTPDPSVPGRAA
ncbi:MAG: energy transducer TonB [Acidobacteriota bacterium]